MTDFNALKLPRIALCALVALAPLTSEAASVLSFEEVGDDVIATLSGSLDLTGATFSNTVTGTNGNFMRSEIGLLASGNGLSLTQNEYNLTGPFTFGTGPAVSSTFDTTNASFVLLPFTLRIAASMDDVPLSGQIGYENQTFASLGLSAGQSVYTLSNGDTFTIDVGSNTSVVPLPASAVLLLGGLLALGGFRCSRKS